MLLPAHFVSRMLVALGLTASAACAGRRAGVPDHLAEWLRTDPQRCLLARDLGENMEAMARRCAELFVLENGYTDLPATGDSTRWVMEAGDRGPWPRVLAGRGGMLQRTATMVQCSMHQCVVFFLSRRMPQYCAYRAVTMTQVFTRIQLEPQEVRDRRCTERQA
jgi:hypothetical protein